MFIVENTISKRSKLKIYSWSQDPEISTVNNDKYEYFFHRVYTCAYMCLYVYVYTFILSIFLFFSTILKWDHTVPAVMKPTYFA